jgi:hypothetical protein
MSALITRNRGVIPKGVDGGRTRMTEAEVPQVNRGSKGSMGSIGAGASWDGVKVTDAIATKQLAFGVEIFNGKARSNSRLVWEIFNGKARSVKFH